MAYEAFVVAREDLGHATGHLLPATALLVARLLDLPAKASAEGKQVAALERQLARAKERGAAGKQAAAEVARLRGALEALRAEPAAPQAESARVGAWTWRGRTKRKDPECLGSWRGSVSMMPEAVPGMGVPCGPAWKGGCSGWQPRKAESRRPSPSSSASAHRYRVWPACWTTRAVGLPSAWVGAARWPSQITQSAHWGAGVRRPGVAGH